MGNNGFFKSSLRDERANNKLHQQKRYGFPKILISFSIKIIIIQMINNLKIYAFIR